MVSKNNINVKKYDLVVTDKLNVDQTLTVS
jgi:hypothetical protein